jgi:hypothetical protein
MTIKFHKKLRRALLFWDVPTGYVNSCHTTSHNIPQSKILNYIAAKPEISQNLKTLSY